VVSLRGRRDRPTDALLDYSERLSRALREAGAGAVVVRSRWDEGRWPASLLSAAREVAGLRPDWVLLQYTALQWSRRGFALGVLVLLWLLRLRGVRVATVFHDSGPWPARRGAGGFRRLVDVVRRLAQRVVMRGLARGSALVVLTVPRQAVSWLPRGVLRTVSLPVGPNVTDAAAALPPAPASAPALAVFSVTGPPVLDSEAAVIARVAGAAAAQVGHLRLVVLGRNSELAAGPLGGALRGTPVSLEVLGLLPPEAVTRALCGCTALLFVRGHVSSGRGSAVAALACGLPIVGWSGPETGAPLTRAGVCLVPYPDVDGLVAATVRVLGDAPFRDALRSRSAAAFRDHFSWRAIAGRLLAELSRE
jgi:hypothetical protein